MRWEPGRCLPLGPALRPRHFRDRRCGAARSAGLPAGRAVSGAGAAASGRPPTNCFLALNAGVDSFEDDLDYHSNSPIQLVRVRLLRRCADQRLRVRRAASLTSITSLLQPGSQQPHAACAAGHSRALRSRNYDRAAVGSARELSPGRQELRFESETGGSARIHVRRLLRAVALAQHVGHGVLLHSRSARFFPARRSMALRSTS